MVDEEAEVAVLVNVPMQALSRMYVVQNTMYISVLPTNEKVMVAGAKETVLEVTN